MNLISYRLLPWLATFVVSGCAYAPGFYTGKSTSFEDPSWSTTTDRRAQSDTPPPGALLSITPDLLRQQRASRKDEVPAEVKKLFGTAKPYIIGAGDILNIVVWDHPELVIAPAGTVATVGSDAAATASSVGNGYNVSSEGLIQFPYVGTIKLAGLTEYQARDLLTKTLAKVIKDPQVTLRIQSYRSGRVYIDGEVRTPGLQAVNDIPMTLPEAIGRAGGFTPLADRAAIAITRNGATTTINLPQLTANGINPTSILLGSGDLVRVMGREDAKVFVLGEVLRPMTQNLRNGRLTLNEALGEAGGVNPNSADPRQIFVVRTINPDLPEIYHLDAKSPLAYALAEGFELQARDVVYVDPVPLVRWNRVISLILPSAQAVTTTRTATGN
jgi:polysaccharide export outer membrane protein